jgi:hypothetical protein
MPSQLVPLTGIDAGWHNDSMTMTSSDLDTVTAEYLDVIRAVTVISQRPPHPDPSEEVDRQRLIRSLQNRESALRCRRDILLVQAEYVIPSQAGAPD